MILAIDPGPKESAFVRWSDRRILDMGIVDNGSGIRTVLIDTAKRLKSGEPWRCVIEMIASYGMPVGADTFETCVWIGRFIERWEAHAGDRCHRLFRREVKAHLCRNSRAKDANVRAALLDAFGGREVAMGKKHAPGPLYGVKEDLWAALAVAVTFDATTPRR